MPSEQINRLKAYYENGDDNIGYDLIRPCLKECISYRRGTAFFSSSSLKSYADALNHIVEDKVRIEILCSPVITDENLLRTLSENVTEDERINTIQKYQEHFIRKTIIKFKEDPDNRSRERSALLAYLIANDLLVIKTAIRKSEGWPNPWPTEKEVDKFAQLYHVKRGYFVFPDGKKIAFDGSFNETDSGHKHNTETANVYKDWADRDQSRADNIIKKVDRDWNEENANLYIRALSKELIEQIKAAAPDRRPKISQKENSPTSEIHQPNPLTIDLWPHQISALSAWKANGYVGILAMATGSGKTRTAIAALKEFRGNFETSFALIVVPKINLANQWVRELKGFGIDCLEAYTGHSWYEKINTEILNLSIASGGYKLPCIVVVMDTLNSDKFQDRMEVLSRSSEKLESLIIVDECHHYNKVDTIQKLPSFFKSRLGLSATPFNQYEDEPDSRFLNNYFDKVVYEYLLGQAIQDTFLTPYNYFIIPVHLDEKETEALEIIDAEIGAMYNASKNDSSYIEALNILNAKKNRLLASIKDKLVKLEEIIKGDRKYNALAYCGASSDEDDEGERKRHIQRVSKIFENMGWRVGKITSDESIKYREEIIEDLEKELLNVVVSIKVLDEGIDIPCCRTAYILASSKSNREFIQRRGRVLRKHKGKRFADIYDFIIAGGHTESKAIDKVVKEEFYRVNEFANLALNKEQIYNNYKKELEEYATTF